MATPFLRNGLGNTLPDDVLVELKATAEQLCSPGKGFLASDESAGPWLRAGEANVSESFLRKYTSKSAVQRIGYP